MLRNPRVFLSLIFISLIFCFCSSSKILNPQKVKLEQSVKIFFMDGTQDNGIVIKKEDQSLIYVSELTHERQAVELSTIRKMEKSELVFDYQANPISDAEIARVKSNRNTWGYAIGGAIIGGAAGLALGLPLWYAEVDDVPPYFIAGATAVAGSIYFAFKGQNKDRQTAIRQIRLQRLAETELEKEVEDEKKKLQEIEQEKKQIQEKLKDKDK